MFEARKLSLDDLHNLENRDSQEGRRLRREWLQFVIGVPASALLLFAGIGVGLWYLL